MVYVIMCESMPMHKHIVSIHDDRDYAYWYLANIVTQSMGVYTVEEHELNIAPGYPWISPRNELFSKINSCDNCGGEWVVGFGATCKMVDGVAKNICKNWKSKVEAK